MSRGVLGSVRRRLESALGGGESGDDDRVAALEREVARLREQVETAADGERRDAGSRADVSRRAFLLAGGAAGLGAAGAVPTAAGSQADASVDGGTASGRVGTPADPVDGVYTRTLETDALFARQAVRTGSEAVAEVDLSAVAPKAPSRAFVRGNYALVSTGVDLGERVAETTLAAVNLTTGEVADELVLDGVNTGTWFAVHNAVALVPARDRTFVVDVSDPERLAVRSSAGTSYARDPVPANENTWAGFFHPGGGGNRLYVSKRGPSYGFDVYDYSDPDAIRFLGNTRPLDASLWASDNTYPTFLQHGHHLFVTASAVHGGPIEVLDISDPLDPRQVGAVSENAHAVRDDGFIDYPYLYVPKLAEHRQDGLLSVVDVADPTAPAVVETVPFPDLEGFTFTRTTSYPHIQVTGGTAYVCHCGYDARRDQYGRFVTVLETDGPSIESRETYTLVGPRSAPLHLHGFAVHGGRLLTASTARGTLRVYDLPEQRFQNLTAGATTTGRLNARQAELGGVQSHHVHAAAGHFFEGYVVNGTIEHFPSESLQDDATVTEPATDYDVDATDGPVTVTLADSLLTPGAWVRVWDAAGVAGTNAITIGGESAPVGDGTVTLATDYGYALVRSPRGEQWVGATHGP